MNLDKHFWEDKYLNNQTGWDIGHISPPLQAYFEQLPQKDLKILIPGCGNGYEAIWLAQNGFSNITVIDLASAPLAHINAAVPNLIHTIQGDFFELEGQFDLIIEQTFFSALPPSLRKNYAAKMAELLKVNGLLAGLLFQIEFPFEGPPFGGTIDEYRALFAPHFEILTLETSNLSIKPRQGNEVFLELRKKG